MDFNTTEYKRRVLDVYKRFDTFCTAHGLRFFSAGGTLLGIVRHGGFIPWDDDIDIVMPRPDYNRFIELTRSQPIEGCEVMSMHTHKDYYLGVAKLVDSNTTLIEERGDVPIGVFIDIFPLDGLPRDKQLRQQQEADFTRLNKRRQYMLAPCGSGLKGLLKKIRQRWFWLFYADASELFLKMDAIASRYPFDEAREVRAFYGVYNDREVMDKSIYDRSLRRVFEDTTIPSVEKTEYYLTRFYGDYMALPPEEQRVSRHHHHFIDMSRRWSTDELKAARIV